MSKYSTDELRARAQEFMVDHIAGGERAFRTVMQVSLFTGLSPSDVVTKIEELANA